MAIAFIAPSCYIRATRGCMSKYQSMARLGVAVSIVSVRGAGGWTAKRCSHPIKPHESSEEAHDRVTAVHRDGLPCDEGRYRGGKEGKHTWCTAMQHGMTPAHESHFREWRTLNQMSRITRTHTHTHTQMHPHTYTHKHTHKYT